MRKIIFSLALLISAVISANAQSYLVDNGAAKDNWYIGGGIGTNVWNDMTSWDLFNAKSLINDHKTNSWWRTQPIHVNVIVGKMFNPYLGAEADYTMTLNLRGQENFIDAHSLTANAVVNISNVIAGYHGKRRCFEIELLGGAGWLHNSNYELIDGRDINGTDVLSVRGAVRGNFNVSKCVAITVTPEYVWLPSNVGNKKNSIQGVNLSIGVKYCISTRRGNFPLCKLYDKTEVDALNSTIATLRSTNESLAKTNKELSETINKMIGEGGEVNVRTNSVGSAFFGKGKAEVNAEEIGKIVKSLKETNGTITLTGNTSPEGSEPINKKLGLSRAKAVKDALVANGIDESRITIKDDYPNQRSVIVTVE